METIAERKAYMLKPSKLIDGKPYSWPELSLAIEGKYTNLRIWIGNEKSIADGCGKQLIYMRLDCYQNYSTPFSKEKNYLQKPNEVASKLLEFYVFGETEVSELDKVLELTEKLKHRNCLQW